MIKARMYDSIQDEHLRGGGDKAAALPNADAGQERGGRIVHPAEKHVSGSDPTEVEKTAPAAVELFSGQAVVAAAFEDKGIKTITVYNDPRMGADLIEDIEVFVNDRMERARMIMGGHRCHTGVILV
jgi:hypothetical protein